MTALGDTLRAQAQALEVQAQALRHLADRADVDEAVPNGLLTVAEVCDLLRLHENTVLRMCADGDLQAWKVRGHWRIPSSQVARMLEVAS